MLVWHRQLRARASQLMQAADEARLFTTMQVQKLWPALSGMQHGYGRLPAWPGLCCSRELQVPNKTQAIQRNNHTGLVNAWQGLCCPRELTGRSWLPQQPNTDQSSASLPVLQGLCCSR